MAKHESKEFEVIFLNNGDAVLQTGDGNYSAVFADMTALAECVHLLMGGESAQGWDGHDPTHRIDTDSEAFRDGLHNGGYQHFDSYYLATSDIWDHAESSWGNVRDFVLELWHCVKQAESDELCEEEVVLASGEWAGVDAAGTAEHDKCFQKYHGEAWSQCHFAVSDDGVRVVTPTDETANGIWTLAEILATEGWSRVEAVAGLMRDAVQE